MSASSKKKLRNEQNAAKMTERQLAEQKEAKKLKIMTISFTAVLAVILVIALVFSAVQFVNNSGIREKNTIAATIGDTELSSAQLNYFYVDAVYDFINTYGSYASLFGLDTTKSLDQQIVDEETGETWADSFVNQAISNAQSTYALVNEANAKGFTLSEDDELTLTSNLSTMELYAQIYGFTDAEDYIQAMYGNGASLKSYEEYARLNTLASAYYNQYAADLSYDEAALKAGEEGKEAEFSTYSYNSYYLNVSSFLEGGTTAEDGTTTYSDEERAAAVEKAEAAAKEILAAAPASIEELDAAIAALEVNAEAETAPTSTAYTEVTYSSLNTTVKDWVIDTSRVAGEVGYIANTTTTTNEDGTETTKINGYYVVYFVGMNDNKFPLVNVRHILVTPSEGTQGSYTEEQMTEAKVRAEELLNQYLSGKQLEENFATLAKENSADNAEAGGLYEDVYPGQMVTNFNDWCFAEGRKAGDTGIVESEYGWHIMYFVGNSETIYRDMLIENALRTADLEVWYSALIEATTTEEKNTKYLSRDLVLSSSN